MSKKPTEEALDEEGHSTPPVSDTQLKETVEPTESAIVEANCLSAEDKTWQDHVDLATEYLSAIASSMADFGLAWRQCNIQYRNNMLRWSFHQTAVSVRVQEDGKISQLHLDTSVHGISQLSGTPVLGLTFKGAHFMGDGFFHECASNRRPDTKQGVMKICAIPPDGNFQLVRYATVAGQPHIAQHEASQKKSPDAELVEDDSLKTVLTQTQLPVTVCTIAQEEGNGVLFRLHAKLSITEEFKQVRKVRCVFPLHPNCRPGSSQIKTSSGRAQFQSVTDAATSVVLWEIERVGKQTGYTEERESIECEREAILDVTCAITGPLMAFPYHQINGEETRPQCIPAESLVADQNLWKKWNMIIGSLHILDDIKKPFLRDRTPEKTQQRDDLMRLKHVYESRIVSSCLSRLLPPVAVSIQKAFGPCFSGLTLFHCSALSTHYPGTETDVGEQKLQPYTPFACATSRELSCAELLFVLHRLDFREDNPDFQILVPEREKIEMAQAEEEESDDSEDRKTAPKNEAKTKVKAASKDLPAKGGAIKGGAIKGRVVKGGGAKGGAMKGRPAAMKK